MSLVSILLRHSKWLVIASALVGVCAGSASAALMAVINSTLHGNRAIGSSTWTYIGLVAMVVIAGTASRILMVKLGLQSTFDMRMSLARQILSHPLSSFENNKAGKYFAALTSDVSGLTAAVLKIPRLSINASIVIGCLVFMGVLSWKLLALFLIVLVVGGASCRLPEARARTLYGRSREAWDAVVDNLRVLTDGFKELKLHDARREAFLSGPLWADSKSLYEYSFKGGVIFAFTNSWNRALYFVFIGVMLFALPSTFSLSAEVLTGYALTILYLRPPLINLLDLLPTFAKARVALEKLERLDLEPFSSSRSEEICDIGGNDQLGRRIVVTGVTHRYQREREEREFMLGPIDLILNPGELIFVVGGNGSGKTTIAKLICGLYVPETGEIQMEGELITDDNRNWYRQHFTVLFSEVFLFESLLGLGSKEDSDAAAQHYLELLQLDHKVSVSQGLLSTVDLSKGQRKRLALLTAYLEDRPVYIFDEWAADQDPVFKRFFYEQLLPDLKMKGKTVVVISHDDQYYHLADRIVKLEDGQIRLDRHISSLSPDLFPVPEVVSSESRGLADLKDLRTSRQGAGEVE